MVYLCLLLFLSFYTHTQETCLHTFAAEEQQMQTQAEPNRSANDDFGDIDFDDLTDQMVNSGIEFTMDDPSSLELLLRKVGMVFVPLLPYYVSVRNIIAHKLCWLDAKQNRLAIRLYKILACCTLNPDE